MFRKCCKFFQEETLRNSEKLLLKPSCAILVWSFCVFAVLNCRDAYLFFYRGTSVATESTDIWGVSGSYRIETWFVENRRHGKNEACNSKNTELLLLWRWYWVAEFISALNYGNLFSHKASHLNQTPQVLCFPLASWVFVLRPCGLICTSAECSATGSWTLSLESCITPSVLKIEALSISSWMPVMYEYFWM